MKNNLLILCVLFALAIVSCSKNEEVTPQNEPITTVSKIENVSLSDIRVDTVWQTKDTILLNFDTPQKVLDFGNSYKDVLDSVSFDFHNLNDSFSFDKEVYLPSFQLSDGLFINSNDSLLVDGFPLNIGFYAEQRTTTTDKYEGSIKNIRIIFKYQRIYISGKVKLEIIDDQKRSKTIVGVFKGSRIGSLTKNTSVWD